MESSPRVTKCFAIITSAHTHPHVTGREAEGQGSGSQTMAGEGSGWLGGREAAFLESLYFCTPPAGPVAKTLCSQWGARV